RLYQNPTTYI
nr:Chain C, 10-meric peptide from Hemagglutinin [H5N1 subtype]3MGO_F Chain F, 10-meric peptide from Hemagglutinin [H5N1 subtype]3MGO_I Chain I, 10-meric peptide from Hemagglutinin [H5N1 subtype]3MGO_L Chain L, 10-meric peptide from Hemagglutinin [H5N1 subtype]